MTSICITNWQQCMECYQESWVLLAFSCTWQYHLYACDYSYQLIIITTNLLVWGHYSRNSTLLLWKSSALDNLTLHILSKQQNWLCSQPVSTVHIIHYQIINTFARGTGGMDFFNSVAAFSYSGANFLQWPHLHDIRNINKRLVSVTTTMVHRIRPEWCRAPLHPPGSYSR